MLDKFLEHNIQKKLHIFSILQLKNSISAKELIEKVIISPTGITALIDELNFDLQGICEIKKESPDYVIHICEGVSSLEIFHAIYQNSNVLKCLKFMIMNDDNLSFSEFAEEQYLTRPSAYRVRRNCVRYLNQIGLDVEKNKVIGAEYRIRYLIALLYHRYGIDCCGIDKASIQLAREFILATNDKIDMCFLENTANEYGYFECLLILSWKRKNHPIIFLSNKLEKLKDVFIYSILKQYIKNIVEARLKISFTENDYNYIFSVYCCTNSCVLADRWTKEDIDYVHNIVFSNPKFNSLLNSFTGNGFEILYNTRAFRSVLVDFSMKCYFNLHCLIPDRHFYYEIQDDPWKSLILRELSKILEKWKQDNNIPYPLDYGHLEYMTIQIASIAQQFLDPVQVIIVSDMTVEIEVLKLYLTRAFSNQRITVKPVMFNAEDLSFMSSLNNCVIIVKKVFAPALQMLQIPASNQIVPISIEINEMDRNAILDAILTSEKNIFKTIVPQNRE